jgi:hypothetical protein
MNCGSRPADAKGMADEYPGEDHEMLKNLAHVLFQQKQRELQRPAITDQDILRAMLGKPLDRQPLETQIRKAG